MRPRSQGGFTLLELTIVLAIVGLLAVGALKAASALRENAGISETSKRLNTLVMALQTFLMKNNRLPCPADPNIDTNLGDENCSSTPILRGVIPGHVLGLSGDRLLDAWDRQFTYVVIAEATQKNSFTSNAWPPTFKLFRPINNQPNQLKQLNQGNEGIVVIISHGANGSGAYLTDGRQTDPQGIEAGQLERENFDPDSTFDPTKFIQATYSTHENNLFDDKVLVLTEDQIVQPLANQGALKTKHAQTLEKLKRIENALVGFIAIHARECQSGEIRIPFADINRDGRGDNDRKKGRVPYRDLSFHQQDDVYDPWDQPIRYEFEGTPSQTGIGCYTSKGYTFTLKSKGPDRTTLNSQPTAKPSENDDITIIKNNYELVGILSAAGINPNPPSDKTPPAN
jgi:prepilin-type N-terminal cleavage/methylation domain-containing protein